MSVGDWLGAPEGPAAATAVEAGLGVLLLVFGRRLFWLAVAALGFGAGLALARLLVGDAETVSTWVVGGVAGAAGAILAILVQRVAVVVAGSLLGALTSATVLARYAEVTTGVEGIVVLAGGLLGAVLSLGAFGLALRLVTSAVGSALVTRTLALAPEWALGLFAALWIVGFLAQGGGRKEGDRG